MKKNKRRSVQNKKLINIESENNINTDAEKLVSSENVEMHFVAWLFLLPMMDKV